jgi:8-oxo-dGTP pyrophosphatase MutT (NUDIX family)/phosphohistidine phosphatase SixA
MSTDAFVHAAGVVALRGEADRQEVLIVHRPHRADWSLPKGKVEPGEHLITTAVRECDEETGYVVNLGVPLPQLRYTALGQPKVVSYWSAAVRASEGFSPNDEIDEVRWLPVEHAKHQLTYPHDSAIVQKAADLPRTTPLILLRHTQAVKRADFGGSNDSQRPLTGKGRVQSKALIPLLDAFGIEQVYSSDATRCMETVRRFAKSIDASVQSEPALSEVALREDSANPARRIRALAHDPRPLVVCSHRPVLPGLVAALGAELGAKTDTPAWDPKLPPGGFIVVHRSFTDSGEIRAISAERHVLGG